MADGFTTNYNLTKPEVGLSNDTWGQKLNDNMDTLDTVIKALEPRSPTGAISIWPTLTAPAGFLLCQGQAISRTTYAALFAVLGTTWGAGNGSTTFNLPDLRGVFIRGLDAGRGLDPLRNLENTVQAEDFKSHTHVGNTASAGAHTHTYAGTVVADGVHTHSVSGAAASAGAHTHILQGNGGQAQAGSVGNLVSVGGATNLSAIESAGAHTHSVSGTAAAAGSHTHEYSGTTVSAGAHTHTVTVDATGGTETRPVNVAMNYIIKT